MVVMTFRVVENFLVIEDSHSLFHYPGFGLAAAKPRSFHQRVPKAGGDVRCDLQMQKGSQPVFYDTETGKKVLAMLV